jgi:hypothetical protein
LQWAEWESGVLASSSQLLVADITPLFGGPLGTGEWPNPIMSWMTNGAVVTGLSPTYVSGATLPMTDFEPETDGYAASPGKVQWWPSNPGALAATATMDLLQLEAEYTSYTAMANKYNTAKSDYETKKTTYNKALADEKTRKADFFKAMFEPAVAIPERPCAPTRPEAFAGLDFLYTVATSAAPTALEKAAKKAVLAQNSGVQAAAASYKLGY